MALKVHSTTSSLHCGKKGYIHSDDRYLRLVEKRIRYYGIKL